MVMRMLHANSTSSYMIRSIGMLTGFILYLKQKTAYEMRISDWSSDVCSSDLIDLATPLLPDEVMRRLAAADIKVIPTGIVHGTVTAIASGDHHEITTLRRDVETDGRRATVAFADDWRERSEEHTSELQSLMRISYAVFCLTKKNNDSTHTTNLPPTPLH